MSSLKFSSESQPPQVAFFKVTFSLSSSLSIFSKVVRQSLGSPRPLSNKQPALSTCGEAVRSL